MIQIGSNFAAKPKEDNEQINRIVLNIRAELSQPIQTEQENMKTKKLSQRSFAVFLTTILLLVAVPASVVFAATSGPNYPGAASGSGWGTPANIGADDTSYATYTIASSGTSTPINASNYGFSIPSGSTIDGITVVISRASSAGT